MAAPVAPVPDESVSPTPRSKIRARIAPGSSSHHHETFVRRGNSSWCSIARPDGGQVEALERRDVGDPDGALRVADLHVLEGPAPPVGLELALAAQPCASHVDRAARLGLDPGP